jgi:prephenate dehydrogenase
MSLGQITIIGVGLIGGSLGWSLKKHGSCDLVVGYGRTQESLQQALSMGVIDRAETDLAKAVQTADVVILAVPLQAMESLLVRMRPFLPDSCLLTDVGSVKVGVVDAVAKVFGEIPPTLVPAHPIAGLEKSGVTAARSDLFEEQRVILTPLPETSRVALSQITELWESVGAEVECMSVDDHDHALAMTSHFPHLLAFLYMQLMGRQGGESLLPYAGSGFRDFSRIAGGHARMWRDISLDNRESLLPLLTAYKNQLDDLFDALDNQQGDDLESLFEQARDLRNQYRG